MLALPHKKETSARGASPQRLSYFAHHQQEGCVGDPTFSWICDLQVGPGSAKQRYCPCWSEELLVISLVIDTYGSQTTRLTNVSFLCDISRRFCHLPLKRGLLDSIFTL